MDNGGCNVVAASDPKPRRGIIKHNEYYSQTDLNNTFFNTRRFLFSLLCTAIIFKGVDKTFKNILKKILKIFIGFQIRMVF